MTVDNQNQNDKPAETRPDYHGFDGLNEISPRWWEQLLDFLKGRSTDEVAIIGNLAAIVFIGTELVTAATSAWQFAGAVTLAALCPLSTALVLSLSRKRDAQTQKERADDTA